MSSCEIRPYQDRDFDTTWRLFHRLSLDYGIGELPTEQQTEAHVRTSILGRDSDVRIVLAFDGSEAVALATFSIMYPSPNRKAQLYMKELFVDASRRGKGHGRAVMQFLARFALDHGCNRLDWTTGTSNPGAMNFYRAIGARPDEEKLYYRFADDELRDFAGQAMCATAAQSGEFEVSTDTARIDATLVHDFLCTTYWAQGRTREVTDLVLRNSLCFGGYLGARQIAFGRVVTDYGVFGYLADVFVLPEYRGRGFGKSLVRSICEHPDVARLQMVLLRTRDAHGLYIPFGFQPLPRQEETLGRYSKS